MRTVHEISEIAGVSVRTLHHYDAIGLLKPTAVTEAGYRLYDDTALERLQHILLFRELEFPLKDIKQILEAPGFDPKEALRQQIALLELRRDRLDGLISFARDILQSGGNTMDFTVFDKSELERCSAESKERWGSTAAYREYEKRAQKEGGMEQTAQELMSLFAELGKRKSLSPDDGEVQALTEKLRQFITEHYYTCTPEIFAGLGKLYAGDERFRKNIDKAGGAGTADFVGQAIECYCKAE